MEKYLINKKALIKDAMKKISIEGKRILFVVDEDNKLYGALSDGNIRKHILGTGNITGVVENACNPDPISFTQEYDIEKIKKLMLKESINAIPIINRNRQIVKILFWNDVFSEKKQVFTQIKLPVVIMAGGKGTRLEPFTKILPKALIPINEKAMLEVIMDEYAKFGMNDFYISINHKAKMIKAYFEEEQSEYSLQYIREDKPLGTAGSLKYLEGKINSPFFVSNCDIIIKDDYSKIYDFHKKEDYLITIVAAIQQYTIPYGICEIENGGSLKSLKEKPEQNYLVNTGMYILNPNVFSYIPENEYFHITDLINILKLEGFKIGVYPVSEKSYIDVGQWDLYKKSIKILNE